LGERRVEEDEREVAEGFEYKKERDVGRDDDVSVL
jgi:hypothetical protein